ncbi:hypothetical protein KHS38_22025 [Mucilaginibacter sp. Bleaf8]|uniref:hypothetical protein n=1 Tax=Mucilaginibacter sp. Bleaf8 TaxID=2834430 RepID=UPI001BD0DC53|nr:hypothetical protein [Mucilaginibacter sp. Bleaf8]MBS7567099.1 hypothetical protein [Mucilaginibacter sp. Bleaf8]
MYRKDHILTEIEKLTRALARLLGLKATNETEEAQQFVNDLLKNDFGLPDDIYNLGDDEFKQLIRQKAYGAGKLDILAQLLYHDATSPLKHPAEAQSLLQKTLILFDVLEQDYRTQSFENITLRSKIHQLLKQYHA